MAEATLCPLARAPCHLVPLHVNSRYHPSEWGWNLDHKTFTADNVWIVTHGSKSAAVTYARGTVPAQLADWANWADIRVVWDDIWDLYNHSWEMVACCPDGRAVHVRAHSIGSWPCCPKELHLGVYTEKCNACAVDMANCPVMMSLPSMRCELCGRWREYPHIVHATVADSLQALWDAASPHLRRRWGRLNAWLQRMAAEGDWTLEPESDTDSSDDDAHIMQ